MGHILHVYLVDEAELKAVIGSKDEAFLNRLLAKNSRELAVTFDLDDQEAHIGNVRTALRTIFAGGPFEEEHAEEYTEALELICADLGPYIDDLLFHWDGDMIDLLYDRPFEDLLPRPEWNGCSSQDKKYNIETIDEWIAEQEAEIDWAEVDQQIRWMYESKCANRDLIYFWGG
ncbi:DUF7691 family protein [Nocardia sp. NPDC003693]